MKNSVAASSRRSRTQLLYLWRQKISSVTEVDFDNGSGALHPAILRRILKIKWIGGIGLYLWTFAQPIFLRLVLAWGKIQSRAPAHPKSWKIRKGHSTLSILFPNILRPHRNNRHTGGLVIAGGDQCGQPNAISLPFGNGFNPSHKQLVMTWVNIALGEPHISHQSRGKGVPATTGTGFLRVETAWRSLRLLGNGGKDESLTWRSPKGCCWMEI